MTKGPVRKFAFISENRNRCSFCVLILADQSFDVGFKLVVRPRQARDMETESTMVGISGWIAFGHWNFKSARQTLGDLRNVG